MGSLRINQSQTIGVSQNSLWIVQVNTHLTPDNAILRYLSHESYRDIVNTFESISEGLDDLD